MTVKRARRVSIFERTGLSTWSWRPWVLWRVFRHQHFFRAMIKRHFTDYVEQVEGLEAEAKASGASLERVTITNIYRAHEADALLSHLRRRVFASSPEAYTSVENFIREAPERLYRIVTMPVTVLNSRTAHGTYTGVATYKFPSSVDRLELVFQDLAPGYLAVSAVFQIIADSNNPVASAIAASHTFRVRWAVTKSSTALEWSTTEAARQIATWLAHWISGLGALDVLPRRLGLLAGAPYPIGFSVTWQLDAAFDLHKGDLLPIGLGCYRHSYYADDDKALFQSVLGGSQEGTGYLTWVLRRRDVDLADVLAEYQQNLAIASTLWTSTQRLRVRASAFQSRVARCWEGWLRWWHQRNLGALVEDIQKVRFALASAQSLIVLWEKDRPALAIAEAAKFFDTMAHSGGGGQFETVKLAKSMWGEGKVNVKVGSRDLASAETAAAQLLELRLSRLMAFLGRASLYVALFALLIAVLSAYLAYLALAGAKK